MIKRTLYFGNPVYLQVKNSQLVVSFPGDQGETKKTGNHTVPIEDVGLVILDHKQITTTYSVLQELLLNKSLLVVCDEQHHPTGMLHSLEGHSEQSRRMGYQIEASEPLKKNLWQQTIAKKLANQAKVLRLRKREYEPLIRWSRLVKSGDPENLEGRGAAHYWGEIFENRPIFIRERKGEPPNSWLNYGYALLRAAMARSLVAAGLNPSLGIHHRNKYNAYCLADDLMEPFRPLVDLAVCQIMDQREPTNEIDKDTRYTLLSLLSEDVSLNGERSPVLVAMQRTANSLVKCFGGETRNLLLPDLLA